MVKIFPALMDLVKKIMAISNNPINYDVIDYPDSYPADEPNRRAPDIKKAKVQFQIFLIPNQIGPRIPAYKLNENEKEGLLPIF